jgi:hypothetical protein
MKPMWKSMLLLAALALFFTGCTGPHAGQATKIQRVTYHGWPDAIRMTSEQAEVVVVPQIGRIMSFRLLNGENVFWEDRSLDGRSGDASGKEWINFGGDKSWPAPEANWSKVTGRKHWMPPTAFDALPVTASVTSVTNGAVTLTSSVDPHYGIRTVRRVMLSGSELSVATTYERVSGEPVKVSVWVITQFKEPVVACVPVRTDSIFTNGYYTFDQKPWPLLRRVGNLIEITRDPKTAHKMGSDARALAWVGAKEICAITPWPAGGDEYPDKGASAEIYTNPDPKKYVELETLGPLTLLKAGERISHGQHYSLHRRSHESPAQDLEAIGFFR